MSLMLRFQNYQLPCSIHFSLRLTDDNSSREFDLFADPNVTVDGQVVEFGNVGFQNPSREFQGTPVVKLGDTFKKVANFEKRFKSIPDITELDHLTINGDVWVGKDLDSVTLVGDCLKYQLPCSIHFSLRLTDDNSSRDVCERRSPACH
jgi:UDP-N-acetylglucosamine pyrophosphorylase